LHGSVQEAMRSAHANYVIQKVVEVMPPAQAGFIVQELRGVATSVACHRYGCRILCRLLEHSMGGELIGEVLEVAETLCRHPFAHHVVESVLEHGDEEQRHRVFLALHSDLVQNAQDPHASFVIQAAFEKCSTEDAQALAHGLVRGGPHIVASLAQTRPGARVLRTLLKLPGNSSLSACDVIQQCESFLYETKHGRLLLEDARKSVGVVVDAAA